MWLVLINKALNFNVVKLRYSKMAPGYAFQYIAYYLVKYQCFSFK